MMETPIMMVPSKKQVVIGASLISGELWERRIIPTIMIIGALEVWQISPTIMISGGLEVWQIMISGELKV
jgi:hypothetical protein